MEYLSLLMFAALLFFLLVGYPVAFTLGGLALFFGLIGCGLDIFTLLPLRLWGRMTNFTLLAVPLFVLMGVTLERTGLAEDLLETMGLIFSRLKGGLAVSLVVVGAILAASTGIVGATVVTMGTIALPGMLRQGYKPELATGTIAAAGTLGQIIPPSIILVILGDIIGVSVGDLFAGAMLPGIILVFLYIIFIIITAYVRPHTVDSFGKQKLMEINKKELALRIINTLLPAGVLIFAVLGSIFFGIASPTEAAAVGAFGTILLALFKRKLTTSILREIGLVTTRLSSMIFMILIGAAAFGLVFRGLGGDNLVRTLLLEMGFGKWGVLIVVMFVIFILGFFLDVIEITFIVIPIISPIIIDLGFNPLWFGILIAVNLQTSFLTPPLGFALFYLKSVSPPSISTGHIYAGIIPFVALQLIGLSAVIFFPFLVTWLPKVIFG